MEFNSCTLLLIVLFLNACTGAPEPRQLERDEAYAKELSCMGATQDTKAGGLIPKEGWREGQVLVSEDPDRGELVPVQVVTDTDFRCGSTTKVRYADGWTLCSKASGCVEYLSLEVSGKHIRTIDPTSGHAVSLTANWHVITEEDKVRLDVERAYRARLNR